ncbi:MAG TPA: tetratricopeptide repeat protein [Coleofasciculaceae cyanobacterium]|jgi:tetratricopeptide (TPR) repeat protein
MSGMPWSKRLSQPALTVAVATGLLLLGGCQQDVVHQRSIAELTQKAQSMMQAGDYNGAVARLEAAYDLQPNETKTMYNLAVAYQMQGNYDKALDMFSQLQDKPGMDKAQIQKAIGITYEAKADALDAEVHEQEENPKADKAQVQQKKQAAVETYQLALQSYQQALAGNGLKNPEEVQKQIESLEAKLKPDSAGADSGEQP